MSNIIPFDSTSGSGVMVAPAHALAAFGNDENIGAKISINQLSYRGKVWRRVVDGEEIILTRKNGEGDDEPVPGVAVVVLDHNKGRSRAFYAGEYTAGENKAPDCYSGDGVKPDAGVKEPCAATCDACPNAVKGSKITPNGNKTTLCSPFKRIAVVPSGAQIASHPPLLLRLAQTSVWDKDNKDNEAKGWYAWDQYLDMLRARGAKHTATVETRVKFDVSKEYPKLLFSASRWLNPDEVEAARQRTVNDKVTIADILSGGNADRDGVSGKPAAKVEPDDDGFGAVSAGPTAAELAAQEQQRQAKAAQAQAEADATAEKKRAVKEKADKAAETKRIAEATAKATLPEDDGFGGGFGDVAAPATKTVVAAETTKPTPAAAATPTKSPPVVETNGAPDGLSALLDGWGSDDPAE